MIDIDLFLQIWGGGCYLLAKILLAIAEGLVNGRKFRIIGWFSYLFGIPAWVILLINNNNWIVASNDIGCIPSMIMGIITAWNHNIKEYKIFDRFVRYFTFSMIMFGIIYSIYYFHGITTFTQLLEIFVIIGFLSGSYFIAKNNPNGWLFFTLMCISMIILLFIQNKILLAILQGISIIVVIFGYIKAIQKKKMVKNNYSTASTGL
jgi:hypothetical protein